RQRIFPVSLSTAVTQPVMGPTGATVPPKLASSAEYFVVPSLTSKQASTEPVTRVLLRRSRVGPFHSTPPAYPGHARMPCGVAPLGSGIIVVTGVRNSTS